MAGWRAPVDELRRIFEGLKVKKVGTLFSFFLFVDYKTKGNFLWIIFRKKETANVFLLLKRVVKRLRAFDPFFVFLLGNVTFLPQTFDFPKQPLRTPLGFWSNRVSVKERYACHDSQLLRTFIEEQVRAFRSEAGFPTNKNPSRKETLLGSIQNSPLAGGFVWFFFEKEELVAWKIEVKQNSKANKTSAVFDFV